MRKIKKISKVALGITVMAISTGSLFAATPTKTDSQESKCNTSIEEKQEILKQEVLDGEITQKKADEISEKLENCDGTGDSKIGQTNGVSFGNGEEKGNRTGEKPEDGTGKKHGNIAKTNTSNS